MTAVGRYQLDLLVQGYPGKTAEHGGLGWSTVAMLRGGGEVVIIDTGGHSYRELLVDRLTSHGLTRDDVTAVVLTHLHWDHACNYNFFPRARVFVPAAELRWAEGQPVGTWYLPELHVEKLAKDESVMLVQDGEDVLPGLRAVSVPGHTPGSMAYIAQGSNGSIIFAGDAVKNQAELMSERADLTLDAALSSASIKRLRALAGADPANLFVCGHDRLLTVVGSGVFPREKLRATITARLTADFDSAASFDLT